VNRVIGMQADKRDCMDSTFVPKASFEDLEMEKVACPEFDVFGTP